MTRATTTTLNINNFKVSAYAQDAYGTYHTLMDQVTVRRTGQNSWTYSPKVNWPGVPVDFFCGQPGLRQGGQQCLVEPHHQLLDRHRRQRPACCGANARGTEVRPAPAELPACPDTDKHQPADRQARCPHRSAQCDTSRRARPWPFHFPRQHPPLPEPTPVKSSANGETQSTTKSEADMTFFQSSADLPHTLSDKQWEAYSAGKFMIPFDLTPFEAGTSLNGTYIAVACRYVDAAKRRNRMAGQLHPCRPLAHRPRLWPCGISARRYHPRLPLASRPLLPLYAYSYRTFPPFLNGC